MAQKPDPQCSDVKNVRHAVKPTTTVLATPAALALHNNFRISVRMLRRDLVRSIHYLVAIYDRKVHRALGFASITDYAAATAGFTRNQTEVFLALGWRLDAYAEVRKAIENGDLSWSKARLIVDRASPDEERKWVDAAGQLGVRALKEAMPVPPRSEPATPTTGMPPTPAIRLDAKPTQSNPHLAAIPTVKTRIGPEASRQPADAACHVTYAFTPEEYSQWSKMHEQLRKRRHDGSNTQILLAALTNLIDGGDMADMSGEPRYLVQLHRCPDCSSVEIRNTRGRFEAPRPLLAVADCDGVIEDVNHRRRSIVPPRMRREVLKRDTYRCRAPGCCHMRFLELHHRVPSHRGGRTEPDNLVTLCSRCHRELHRREADLREAARDPTKSPR